jgi:hypothetical protein
MTARQSPQSYAFAEGETLFITFTVDQTITGDTIRFVARRTSAATPVLSTEDATVVATITDTDELTIEADTADTLDLIGTYRYSLEAEDVTGDKSELAWGYLTFKSNMVSDDGT